MVLSFCVRTDWNVCVFISVFCSAIIYFLGLEASEVIMVFAYMLYLQIGLWLWSIHSYEDNVVLNQSFSVMLSSLKTWWRSLCTCFISWDSMEIWQLDSSLFLFVFLIGVLQCKHLQKHVDSIPCKTWTPRGIHVYEMEFSLHWSQTGFLP